MQSTDVASTLITMRDASTIVPPRVIMLILFVVISIIIVGIIAEIKLEAGFLAHRRGMLEGDAKG